MAYLTQIECLIRDLEAALGKKTKHAVGFVRTGSFEVKITIFEPEPVRARTFNLSGGITPGIARAIREWYEWVVGSGGRKEPALRGHWVRVFR
jgi:hypothetical protein